MFKYSKKVMEHFLNPRNVGEIKNADGIGRVGNPVCGDVMWVYIKVGKRKSKGKREGKDKKRGKEEEYIKDIKFKTLGCAAAIATSSMITELAKGKTLEEAKKITRDDISSALKGLPPIKMHCSNLAAKALRKAIDNYEKRKKRKHE